MTVHSELAALKQSLRERARALRRAQPDRAGQSAIICRKLSELPEYAAARTVLFYVDARSEVQTRDFLPTVLAGDKHVVVPFCRAERLELFRLESLSELAEGSYRILEPNPALQDDARRRVVVEQLDLAVIPGVAFDLLGGRLGQGQGYYDRLLAGAPQRMLRVALAFECQLFASVPRDAHDAVVDVIITEKAVYRPAETVSPTAG